MRKRERGRKGEKERDVGEQQSGGGGREEEEREDGRKKREETYLALLSITLSGP